MHYYSDPTAARALGGIHREFARLEKKAKKLRTLFEAGRITANDLKTAQAQFTGIYRHVLRLELEKEYDGRPALRIDLTK